MRTRIVNQDMGWIQHTGDIDGETSPELIQHVSDLLEQNVACIVLDLTTTDFISSSGIGIIAVASKDAKRSDTNFVMVCAEPRLLSLFEITSLSKIIPVFESFEDAQTSFSNQA